jgi:hypothetical protein
VLATRDKTVFPSDPAMLSRFTVAAPSFAPSALTVADWSFNDSIQCSFSAPTPSLDANNVLLSYQLYARCFYDDFESILPIVILALLYHSSFVLPL